MELLVLVLGELRDEEELVKWEPLGFPEDWRRGRKLSQY